MQGQLDQDPDVLLGPEALALMYVCRSEAARLLHLQALLQSQVSSGTGLQLLRGAAVLVLQPDAGGRRLASLCLRRVQGTCSSSSSTSSGTPQDHAWQLLLEDGTRVALSQLSDLPLTQLRRAHLHAALCEHAWQVASLALKLTARSAVRNVAHGLRLYWQALDGPAQALMQGGLTPVAEAAARVRMAAILSQPVGSELEQVVQALPLQGGPLFLQAAHAWEHRLERQGEGSSLRRSAQACAGTVGGLVGPWSSDEQQQQQQQVVPLEGRHAAAASPAAGQHASRGDKEQRQDARDSGGGQGRSIRGGRGKKLWGPEVQAGTDMLGRSDADTEQGKLEDKGRERGRNGGRAEQRDAREERGRGREQSRGREKDWGSSRPQASDRERDREAGKGHGELRDRAPGSSHRERSRSPVRTSARSEDQRARSSGGGGQPSASAGLGRGRDDRQEHGKDRERGKSRERSSRGLEGRGSESDAGRQEGSSRGRSRGAEERRGREEGSSRRKGRSRSPVVRSTRDAGLPAAPAAPAAAPVAPVSAAQPSAPVAPAVAAAPAVVAAGGEEALFEELQALADKPDPQALRQRLQELARVALAPTESILASDPGPILYHDVVVALAGLYSCARGQVAISNWHIKPSDLTARLRLATLLNQPLLSQILEQPRWLQELLAQQQPKDQRIVTFFEGPPRIYLSVGELAFAYCRKLGGTSSSQQGGPAAAAGGGMAPVTAPLLVGDHAAGPAGGAEARQALNSLHEAPLPPPAAATARAEEAHMLGGNISSRRTPPPAMEATAGGGDDGDSEGRLLAELQGLADKPDPQPLRRRLQDLVRITYRRRAEEGIAEHSYDIALYGSVAEALACLHEPKRTDVTDAEGFGLRFVRAKVNQIIRTWGLQWPEYNQATASRDWLRGLVQRQGQDGVVTYQEALVEAHLSVRALVAAYCGRHGRRHRSSSSRGPEAMPARPGLHHHDASGDGGDGSRGGDRATDRPGPDRDRDWDRHRDVSRERARSRSRCPERSRHRDGHSSPSRHRSRSRSRSPARGSCAHGPWYGRKRSRAGSPEPYSPQQQHLHEHHEQHWRQRDEPRAWHASMHEEHGHGSWPPQQGAGRGSDGDPWHPGRAKEHLLPPHLAAPCPQGPHPQQQASRGASPLQPPTPCRWPGAEEAGYSAEPGTGAAATEGCAAAWEQDAGGRRAVRMAWDGAAWVQPAAATRAMNVGAQVRHGAAAEGPGAWEGAAAGPGAAGGSCFPEEEALLAELRGRVKDGSINKRLLELADAIYCPSDSENVSAANAVYGDLVRMAAMHWQPAENGAGASGSDPLETRPLTHGFLYYNAMKHHVVATSKDINSVCKGVHWPERVLQQRAQEGLSCELGYLKLSDSWDEQKSQPDMQLCVRTLVAEYCRHAAASTAPNEQGAGPRRTSPAGSSWSAEEEVLLAELRETLKKGGNIQARLLELADAIYCPSDSTETDSSHAVYGDLVRMAAMHWQPAEEGAGASGSDPLETRPLTHGFLFYNARKYHAVSTYAEINSVCKGVHWPERVLQQRAQEGLSCELGYLKLSDSWDEQKGAPDMQLCVHALVAEYCRCMHVRGAARPRQ